MLEKTNHDASYAVQHCSANHLKNKHIEEKPLLKDASIDTFTSQQPLLSTIQTGESISRSFCNRVDPTIFNVLKIFSPLVDLVMGVNSLENPENSKEEIVSSLSNVLKGIQSSIESNKDLNGKLSKRASEALDRLYKSMSLIEGNKDIKSMDIQELISHWKESKNHKALLEMAERIRNGQCSHISNRDLRRGLIEALESFAASLEEASNHPQNKARDEVIEILQDGASEIVENVTLIEEKGGDENLTENDKQTITENFQRAKEKAEEVVQDPKKSEFIENSKKELIHWISYITNLIEEWGREEKEEEIKEKKKKDKEICQFRHLKEKEIAEYKKRLNLKKKLANRLNSAKEKIKNKIEALTSLLKFGKPKNPDKIISALNNYRKKECRVDYKHDNYTQSELAIKNTLSMSSFELELSRSFDGEIDCHC